MFQKNFFPLSISKWNRTDINIDNVDFSVSFKSNLGTINLPVFELNR